MPEATGEMPAARFERDEAHRLNSLGGQPSFRTLRELTRVVEKDFTLAAGIRHGAREVAAHSFRIQDTGDKEPASGSRQATATRPSPPPRPPGRWTRVRTQRSIRPCACLGSDVTQLSPLQQLDR